MRLGRLLTAAEEVAVMGDVIIIVAVVAVVLE